MNMYQVKATRHSFIISKRTHRNYRTEYPIGKSKGNVYVESTENAVADIEVTYAVNIFANIEAEVNNYSKVNCRT